MKPDVDYADGVSFCRQRRVVANAGDEMRRELDVLDAEIEAAGAWDRVDMNVPGPYPFHGEVRWLTVEEGGRRTGPPSALGGYAVTAFVPPAEEHASFVLRGFELGAWKSSAEGRWLAVENSGAWRVQPGSIVKVCEGPRHVADFAVTSVDDPAP